MITFDLNRSQTPLLRNQSVYSSFEFTDIFFNTKQSSRYLSKVVQVQQAIKEGSRRWKVYCRRYYWIQQTQAIATWIIAIRQTKEGGRIRICPSNAQFHQPFQQDPPACTFKFMRKYLLKNNFKMSSLIVKGDMKLAGLPYGMGNRQNICMTHSPEVMAYRQTWIRCQLANLCRNGLLKEQK